MILEIETHCEGKKQTNNVSLESSKPTLFCMVLGDLPESLFSWSSQEKEEDLFDVNYMLIPVIGPTCKTSITPQFLTFACVRRDGQVVESGNLRNNKGVSTNCTWYRMSQYSFRNILMAFLFRVYYLIYLINRLKSYVLI